MNALLSQRAARIGTATACTLFALAGCGKVAEVASQKAAEKVLEASMEKDGAKNAKIDTSNGTFKASVTDKDGKQVQMELGGAKVSEADVGVPFYPGATVDASQSTKIASGDATMSTVTLKSADKGDKIADFYRARLKSASEGKQFMEMSEGEGKFMLMLNDDKASSSTQVHIAPGDGGGSQLTIVASLKKAG